jgi:DNA-binding beta-propeller fold protein YncE
VFASSANGGAEPVRTIEGQATLLSRTSHQIAMDPIHDEIITTNPFAEAILFFRGAAKGEEPPIRTIQGPDTKLMHIGVDNISVDPVNGEVYTANQLTDTVLVFNRLSSGNVAPVRMIHGPKTRLHGPRRAEVDPVNNIIVVAQMQDPKGLLIFNRTDDGDVAPKAIISGPKTLMEGEGVKRHVLFPQGKEIFALVRPGRVDGKREGLNFIGIWKYSDNGNVPPYAMLRANDTTKIESAGGIALNPKTKEIYVDSGTTPASLLTFYLPEMF